MTAVVPARDEAAILPETLPTLLAQDYPGRFAVVLVDDASTRWHRGGGRGPGRPGAALRVVSGGPPPPGWAGKVWAMAQGVTAAGECDYLLFTDADIAFAPGALAGLVRAAVAGDRALVSQMALLRADTGWERWIVPAFVYFFAQLYPFRRVGRPRSRTAAAAGGCMLVRRDGAGGRGWPGPHRRAPGSTMWRWRGCSSAARPGALLARFHGQRAQPPSLSRAWPACGTWSPAAPTPSCATRRPCSRGRGRAGWLYLLPPVAPSAGWRPCWRRGAGPAAGRGLVRGGRPDRLGC